MNPLKRTHTLSRMLKQVFAKMPAIMLLLTMTLVIVPPAVHAGYSKNPVVNTINGRVRGVQMPGVDGVPYDAFYGIPFAKPPVELLRFANPQLPNSWHSIRDTTAPKPDCIQKNSLLPQPTTFGDEDCLYLNLYRPLRSTDVHVPLPVIVFIHGGAFFSGSPSPAVLGPQYFMNTGQVIFVTIAYRLGALGFLSTGDQNSPGNFGLKDQSMALNWVKNNVQRFGGNPANVTIMGVSAGAASVHMHMMSPLSKDLFHRAVSLSGNALGPYNDPTLAPLELARKQAAVLGIPTHLNNSDLVTKLRAVPARRLVDSIDNLKFWSVDPLTLFRLVVEEHDSRDAFLTANPSTISITGDYKTIVPWIQGSVQNEGAIRSAPILSNQMLLADLNERLDELLPALMELNATEENTLDDITTKIKQRYLNGANHISAQNSLGFTELYSERSFLYPLYNSVYDFVRNPGYKPEQTPIYIYKFNFTGPISFSAPLTNTLTNYGVIHQDDTIYLFGTDFWPPFGAETPEGKMTRALVQFYVDFAVTGRPGIEFGEVAPCTKNTIYGIRFCDYYMFLNSDSECGYSVSSQNFFDFTMIDFWNGILPESSPKRITSGSE